MAFLKGLQIYDIDGVLLKWREDFVFEICTPPCEDTIAQLKAQYEAGDWVVLWTARAEWQREMTEEHLIDLGVKFHLLCMDKNTHIDVYDDSQVVFNVHQMEPQTYQPEIPYRSEKG